MHNFNTKNIALYQTLINSINEGMVVSDFSGYIVFVNPKAVDLFGYQNANELIGEKIEILLPPELREVHNQHRKTYTQSPKQRPMGTGLTLEGIKKDGTKFFVEVSLNYFEYEKKNYVLSLVNDITPRKHIQDKLEQLNHELEKRVAERTNALNRAVADLEKSQRLYEAIARNFPKGTINVFDKNLNYIFAEGQDLFKYGITSKMLMGKNYLKKIPHEIKPIIEENLKKVFQGQSYSFEIKYLENYYLINAVPLMNEKGEIENILLVEQNITEQKKAEIEIKKALDKEKELNEFKARFVSMASHEFRTPLSTIHSSVTLIEKYIRNNMPEYSYKHIDRIKSAISNLTGILNDFLSYSKLEEGKISTHLNYFNIAELIKKVAEDMQQLTKKEQIIRLYFENGTETKEIYSDAAILQNILVNLISNAIKYSPDDGTIEITLKKTSPDYIEIHVTDHGIGIPLKDQPYMFNRFFRAANALNIEGTGLGLNIVKKYVEMLNGIIYFKSRENEGTTFSVIIPEKFPSQ